MVSAGGVDRKVSSYSGDDRSVTSREVTLNFHFLHLNDVVDFLVARISNTTRVMSCVPHYSPTKAGQFS